MTGIWVNIGSGNGLLPDGTKPLPEPKLSYHQYDYVAFIWGQLHWECFKISVIKLCLKFKHLKSQPQLPADNELIQRSPTGSILIFFSLKYMSKDLKKKCWWLIAYCHMENHIHKDIDIYIKRKWNYGVDHVLMLIGMMIMRMFDGCC